MNTRYLLLMTLLCTGLFATAQKTYVNGSPITIVDANNHTPAGPLGDAAEFYNWVGVSGDQNTLFTTNFNTDLLLLDTQTDQIFDSVPITTYDMEAGGPDHMFLLGNGVVYVLEISTMALDSVATGPEFNYRIEKRPGVDEMWVSAEKKIYVIDYNGALTATSFDISTEQYDNGDIKFPVNGNMAYKLNGVTKNLLKIDASTKQIIDSVKIPGQNVTGMEVTGDGNHAFVSNSLDKKIYKVQTSDMTVVDSVSTAIEAFGLYRHPDKQELWAVMHFDDQIWIFDHNLGLMDSIPVGLSPHNLAFTNKPVGATNIAEPKAAATFLTAYPNPAFDRVTIQLPTSENASLVQVMDMTGKLMGQVRTTDRQLQWDVAAYPKGAYFIRIASGETMYRSTFVKL